MTDFCISRPMMDRVLQQAELLDQMMEVAGVDPARAAGLDKGMAWYEARSRCIACIHDRRCRSWVAEQDARPTVPPDYCPNVGFFRIAKGLPSQQAEDCHEPALANVDATLAARNAQSPQLLGT